MYARQWRQILTRTLKAFRTAPRTTPPRPSFRPRVEGLEDRAVPATINLGPVADNTLYQDQTGRLSNGAGRSFFVGATNQGSNNIRRGAIRFDLSAIPAGSTVTSATLALHMGRTNNGAQNIELHRALRNWGEGTSNAGAGGVGANDGDGTQATTNDVTWLFTFFNTQSWTVAGGDFAAASSAATSVGGVGNYQWSAAGMIADVQQWVNDASGNFGWIITGNEATRPTAKAFDTKEGAVPANRPLLTVVYTTPAPDLTIAKSHGGDFRQGESASYTLTVGNAGAGSTSGVVTLTDTLPTGLVPSAANNGVINGWTVSTSGQTVTATRGDPLAAGNNYPSLPIVVTVANNAPPSVTNIANVSGGGDVNPANNSASDPTTIGQAADLTISKSHVGDFRQGNASDTYTLIVANSGTGPTAGVVTITDTLPAGLTPTAANNGVQSGWTVSTDGQVVTATRNDALSGGTSYPSLTITVAVANDAPANVVNTATVSGGGDVNAGNNSASDPTTIAQAADLAISKSHAGSFRQGDAANTYTLTVRNIGPGPTVGAVTITDTLPAGLLPTAANNGIINGWTVSATGQTVTATRSDALAAQTDFPALTLTVSVANNAPPNVTNTASVAGGGELRTDNNDASDPTTILQVADLTIIKSHSGNFRQGEANSVYTLVVNNVGTGTTVGAVTLTDTFPAGLTPTTGNGVINGWSVSTNGQTVTATRSDILAGGNSYPALTLTVSVANNAPALVTNTATVAGGGEVNAANNTAGDPTTIVQVADLTIGKSHSGDFRQGDAAASYTLTVSNVSQGATVGAVTITDTLPAGLVPAAANNGTINGWTVSTNGQTVTATRSDVLAGGNSYPALVVTVAVAATAPASVTNIATVSGGGELETANNSVSDPTTVIQLPDLAIDKSHSGAFSPGGSANTYTITVSNVGAAPTDGSLVTVIDTLPPALTSNAANNGVINGWTVVTSGQTVTATRDGVLANGGSYPALILTVAVALDAPASFINRVTVSGGGDINTANNTADDPTFTTPVADLVIGKSHSGTFRQGDAANSYTISVSNIGPEPTTGAVTVTDTLPAGLAPTAANSGVINGWTVSVNGQTVTASRNDPLGSGASYPALPLIVSVANDAPANVTNTATVSGGGESNAGNNSASDSTAILQVADLTVSKSHSGDFRQGEAASAYTLIVNNIGAGPTAGTVTLTDILPAGLTPTTASGVINGWSVSSSGQTVTATRSDVLASGNSYPALTLSVNVASNAPPSVINTVTIAGGGEVNTANNSANDPTTITQAADLTIGKSHSGDFRQGDAAAVYTLVISNAGTGSTLGAVTVTDTLPAGLAPTAANNGVINGWTVSTNGQTFVATRSDVLASGNSYPALTLTVSVAGNAPPNVTNTATVSGGGDVNLANNSADDRTAITQVADLTISKSHSGDFRQGDAAGIYTLTVSNSGLGPTVGTVTVTDTLPTGLVPTAANTGVINGWTVTTNGQIVTATRGDVLGSGASYPSLTLTVAVSPTAPASITNTVAVSGGGELETTNNSASDVTAITQLADLTIEKSHADDFHPGDRADTYTITVRNIGAAPTDGGIITVTDTLPAGLMPTAANAGTINGWTISVSGQTVTATRSDVLASGASYPALVLTVAVAEDAPLTVTNTAAVSGGGEVNFVNNSDDDRTTITPLADLVISKGHSGEFRQGDAAATFTLTVTNIGAGPTFGTVTVTDSLPAGFAPTVADSGVINGWTVSFSGQTIVATRSDVLASGASYPPLIVTVSVAGNAPASVTNVVTVSGGGESNVANDTAFDVIAIQPGDQVRRRRGA
jgi:uncharacterized repeat protein (TIGR01451 family)